MDTELGYRSSFSPGFALWLGSSSAEGVDRYTLCVVGDNGQPGVEDQRAMLMFSFAEVRSESGFGALRSLIRPILERAGWTMETSEYDLLDEVRSSTDRLYGWVGAEDAPPPPLRMAGGVLISFRRLGVKTRPTLQEVKELRQLALQCGRVVYGENAPGLPEIEE